jgi:hypothetical protein
MRSPFYQRRRVRRRSSESAAIAEHAANVTKPMR